jgi:preprotein translocase subunit YajC
VAYIPVLLLMVGVFYFLLWRPQQRRVQNMRALQGALELGDEVITTAGVYGKIRALRDDHVELEIAPGTVIKLARGAIGQRIVEPNETNISGDPHDGTDGLEETG